MTLWKKMWLLFSVIWVVVAGLNVMTILAFSEEHEKVWRPLLLAFAVPAAAYLLAWTWFRFRKQKE
jgi:cyanate permease